MLTQSNIAVPKHWSTSDVPQQASLAYWTETVFRSLYDFDPTRREDFRAELSATPFGPATLFVMSCDPQIARRTKIHLAKRTAGGFFLAYLREGEQRFSQMGRDSFMRAGDLLLIHDCEPYEFHSQTSTRVVSMHFDGDWLRNWIAAPENLAGRVLHFSSGWGSALTTSLATLDAESGRPLALPPSTVAEQIASLLALAAGPDAHLSSPSEKLLKRIRCTLRDRCHEPGLDPHSVASSHGISKRYLHQLFSKASTTFGRELIRTRLDVAQRMMSDARYDALSVGEIALRCGFVGPSHFSRRFRIAYGVAPLEFRATRRTTRASPG